MLDRGKFRRKIYERNNMNIIHLTTNKERPDALRFYEKLGFKAKHEGMKLYLEQK